MNMQTRIDRLQVLIAFDDAISADVQMTIICYVNGQIKPWKDFPSMFLRDWQA